MILYPMSSRAAVALGPVETGVGWRPARTRDETNRVSSPQAPCLGGSAADGSNDGTAYSALHVLEKFRKIIVIMTKTFVSYSITC